ncbi:MAG: DnaJ domain-containing protein [Clostridia bacterium]|nr:DnaJ domain-containing protein [Clostridia bacterium]
MNPYQVLGVSESVNDEDLRAAYLALVKKYHPDKYQDNPLKDLAGEKLKEINEAYDTIVKARSSSSGYAGSARKTGYANSGSQAGSAHNYDYTGSSYSGQYQNEFNRVRECLNRNAVREARAVLEAIPLRNAEWNYLYGITLFRSGEFSAARSYLETAATMEPSNSEYRSAYNNTAARGTRSYHTYNRSGGDSMRSTCNCCSTLLCADCCCECMGSDLIPWC